MAKDLDRVFFWLSFSVLTILYLLCATQAPSLIERSYNDGAWKLLNFVTSVKENQSLAFYQGMVLERFFGPVKQLISGILLTMFCWRYIDRLNSVKLGGVVFCYLILTKFDVLFFPPYGEMAGGPLAEAIWLYRNHFDYPGLLDQPNVDNGGPKVYLFSLYPGLAALLLAMSPSIKAFITGYHILTFAQAAAVAALFSAAAEKMYNRRTALLLAIVLLSLPLFQSMIEVVNMEMLCFFFAVCSMYFLANKKIGAASVMAVLSAAVKGPGGIICAGVFVAGWLLFLFDPAFKGRKRILIYSTLALLLGLLNLYCLRTFVSPVQTPAGTIKILVGWEPVTNCRFLIIGLIFSFTGFALAGARYMSKKSSRSFIMDHYVPLVCFVMTVMWFLMYLNVSVMGPRYKLLLAPFLLLCVFFSFTSLVSNEKIRNSALLVTIALASLGSYGMFHPAKIKSHPYAFNELERTLEYRNDLKLDILLAGTLAGEYGNAAIGAPWVIAQQLAMPELGYINKPLDVFMYGFRVNYGGIKSFQGLARLNLNQTIWVGFPDEPNRQDMEFPIDPLLDRIVKELQVGDKRVTIFQGGFAIEKRRRMIEMYREKVRQKQFNSISNSFLRADK